MSNKVKIPIAENLQVKNAFYISTENEVIIYHYNKAIAVMTRAELWKGLCDELEAWLNGNLYHISLETRNAYEANHYTSIGEGAEWLANGFNDAFADEWFDF